MLAVRSNVVEHSWTPFFICSPRCFSTRFSESNALFSFTLNSKKLLQYLSHRIFAARVWSIKCKRKEKLIAQFGGKLRDERFEPN